MWHWSGVYHPTPAAADNDVTNPLGTALQSAIAILRGEDNELTRLALARSDKEWADDISRIQACKGHEELTIEQVNMYKTAVFAITSAVKNNNGKNMICELVFMRQANGTWKLQLIDIEPADNAKRDTDRFHKDYPKAKQIQIPYY